jgi:hypothetical protein
MAEDEHVSYEANSPIDGVTSHGEILAQSDRHSSPITTTESQPVRGGDVEV